MSETTTEELTPALFDHAKRLYEEMLTRSHKETVEQEGQEMPFRQVDVYEGHLTRLFAELALPNPYYTKILDCLKAQNCIEQLRRGGGVAQSRWVLLSPPSEESFKIITERKRAPKGKMAVLEQRTTDLMKLTNQLQDRVERLSTELEKVQDDLNTMRRVL